MDNLTTLDNFLRYGVGPLAGGLLLLCLLSFCTCCICKRVRAKRRQNRANTNNSSIPKNESTQLELTSTAVPIDYATGQLSQQELSSKSKPNSELRLSNSEEGGRRRDRNEKEFVQLLEDQDGLAKRLSIMTNSTALLTSLPASDDTLTMQGLDSPQHSSLKKGHSYEDIVLGEEPKYDDIIAVSTAVERNIEKSTHNNLDGPQYHVLCDPSLDVAEGKDKPRKSSKTLASSTSRHFYEDIETSRVHQYDILTSGLDPNPLQDSVVQEDKNSPTTEDAYYSTARGHRLVPVGKPMSKADHMYEILDSGAKRYSKSTDNLVRSYSVASRSLERLDPMYDEPFKAINRSSSVPKVNIYDMDSLFDDPKYDGKNPALKGSVDKIFDDPSYWTRKEARAATERHISFTVEPQEISKSSHYRPAASRKTK